MIGFDVISFGRENGACLYHITHRNEMPMRLPKDYPLAVISVYTDAWGRDLTPWPAPALRPGEEDFSGGADEFLREWLDDALPRMDAALGYSPRRRFTAGYSLGGLFALYAVTKSGLFSGCACMSGSLWYPGWGEYLRTLPPEIQPERLYFSLGKKEGGTRHPVMRNVTVGFAETVRFFEARGVPCEMVWHPGGHFQQPDARVRAGLDYFAALCGAKEE